MQFLNYSAYLFNFILKAVFKIKLRLKNATDKKKNFYVNVKKKEIKILFFLRLNVFKNYFNLTKLLYLIQLFNKTSVFIYKNKLLFTQIKKILKSKLKLVTGTKKFNLKKDTTKNYQHLFQNESLSSTEHLPDDSPSPQLPGSSLPPATGYSPESIPGTPVPS